jgi:hypothetical protein
LKKPAARKERREIFVLTPEEKRIISFILMALFLGAAAKHYRGSHSVPPAKTAIAETARSAGLPAQKRAEAKKRKLAQ